MNKLEKAKEIIRKHYAAGTLGIFDCRNTAGDFMTTVYDEDGLTIDMCYHYEYFEVFGLTNEEFSELEEYYNSLWGGRMTLDDAIKGGRVDDN